MVYLQSRYSSADFFPFLHLTIVALFSFTEVKMSNIVVVCVPPLWALLFSFPRHAAIPLTTGSTEPLLLPALGNHARLQLCRVVRHPPWQQMCARLWRLPWRRLFVRFPLILSGLVITPHRAVVVSTSVENGTINDIIVLDVVLLSVLWMWPPQRLLQPLGPPLPQGGCCLASWSQ